MKDPLDLRVFMYCSNYIRTFSATTLQIFGTVMVTGFYCVTVSWQISFIDYRKFPYGNSL